jgi:hypothetical protein
MARASQQRRIPISPRKTLNKSSGSRRWRCGLSPRGVASYARSEQACDKPVAPCTRRHDDADRPCGNDAVGCRRCSGPAPCGLRRNRALANVLATSVSCRASWHCGLCHRRCEALLAFITISPATRLPETYSVFPWGMLTRLTHSHEPVSRRKYSDFINLRPNQRCEN